MLLLYSLRVSFLYLSPGRNLILTGQQCVFIRKTKRVRQNITVVFISRFYKKHSLTLAFTCREMGFSGLRNRPFHGLTWTVSEHETDSIMVQERLFQNAIKTFPQHYK